MGLPLFLPSDEWLYRTVVRVMSLVDEGTHFASRLQKSVPYGFMVHGTSLLFAAPDHDGLQSWQLRLPDSGATWENYLFRVCGIAEAVRCRRLGTKSRNPYWR